MFGSAASTPPPPALPDPLPTAPSYASGTKAQPSGNANKTPGFGSTLMTGPEGFTAGLGTNVLRKSLLGQ